MNKKEERNMKVVFTTPSDSMAERIYESYRMDGEPDAPSEPINKLNTEEKEKWIHGIKTVSRIISLDGNEIGFITIINRYNQVNLGFGVFQEYRKRGYMTAVIPEAVSFIKSMFPDSEIYSSVEVSNEPARKVLIRSGCESIKKETKFNAVYEKYKFPF